MKCPSCQGRLIHKTGREIRMRIEGPIIIKDNLAKSHCFHCGNEVSLPISLDSQVQEQVEKAQKEHLIVVERGLVRTDEKV